MPKPCIKTRLISWFFCTLHLYCSLSCSYISLFILRVNSMYWYLYPRRCRPTVDHFYPCIPVRWPHSYKRQNVIATISSDLDSVLPLLTVVFVNWCFLTHRLLWYSQKSCAVGNCQSPNRFVPLLSWIHVIQWKIHPAVVANELLVWSNIVVTVSLCLYQVIELINWK